MVSIVSSKQEGLWFQAWLLSVWSRAATNNYYLCQGVYVFILVYLFVCWFVSWSVGLFVCLSVGLQKKRLFFHGPFWKGVAWTKEELINFWS